MDEREAFAAEVALTRRILQCCTLYEERRFPELQEEAEGVVRDAHRRGEGHYYLG
jgi:hypothetical protein